MGYLDFAKCANCKFSESVSVMFFLYRPIFGEDHGMRTVYTHTIQRIMI